MLKPKQTEVEIAKEAATKVVQTHHRLSDFLKPGLKLPQIDDFIRKTLSDLKCKSAFFGYARGVKKFPSYACLSVNDCVVHGTAGYYEDALKPGDVIKIDVGVSYKGWIGDAAWTYAIKEQSPDAKRLMDCGKEAINRGITKLVVGNTLSDWANEVFTVIEKEHNLRVIEALGGHGYGRKLHEQPYIANLPLSPNVWSFANLVIEEDMLFAVEPMIALTTRNVKHEMHRWPILTADGSLSVHYEHDILTTKDGPEILTKGLESLPDVVG